MTNERCFPNGCGKPATKVVVHDLAEVCVCDKHAHCRFPSLGPFIRIDPIESVPAKTDRRVMSK